MAITDTSTALDEIFDAFDSIDGIARAILSGNEDHISLAKGIKHIATDMLAVVDEMREQSTREKSPA